MKEECTKCDGKGEIAYIDVYSYRMLGDVYEICKVCGGTGLVDVDEDEEDE